MATDNPVRREGTPLSESIIAQLEHQLGAGLPKGYITFLLRNNGGIPKNAYFTLLKGERLRDYWVDRFLSIDERLAAPDLDASPETLSFWNYHFHQVMPSDVMLIGTVCTYDRLVLYIRGPRSGEVHLVDWDRVDESREWTREDIERAMRYVAPSFEEFINGLYAAPRYE